MDALYVAFACLALLLLFFIIIVLVILVDDTRQRLKRYARRNRSCGCSNSNNQQSTKCCGKCESVKPCKDGKDGCCLDFASFVAVLGCQDGAPNDNPNPIPGGEAIRFPTAFAQSGKNNIILNPDAVYNQTAILFKEKGIFNVEYQIPLSAPGGQLVIVLQNNTITDTPVEQPETVIGTPGTGGDVVTGVFQVIIEQCNVNLSIRNPVDDTTPIQLTACAGSSSQLAGNAWLRIVQLA
jgi:hypothetical protein